MFAVSCLTPGSRRLTRSVALFLVALLFFPGCTTRKAISPPNAAGWMRAGAPPRVHVTLMDGREFTFEDARVAADSLAGWIARKDFERIATSDERARAGVFGRPALQARIRYAIPFESIRLLQVTRHKVLANQLLLTAGLAVLVVVILVAVLDDEDVTLVEFCPLVSSWNGSAWELEAAPHAGAIFPTLANCETSVLQHARPDSGALRLQLTGGEGSSDFVDALHLLVVDHAPDRELVPDGDGTGLLVSALEPPHEARDGDGRDVTLRVKERDLAVWESAFRTRDFARDEDREAVLDLVFHRHSGASRAALVLDAKNSGWAAAVGRSLLASRGPAYEAFERRMDEDTAAARAFVAPFTAASQLKVSLWDGAAWREQGRLGLTGPEVAKRSAVRIDLGSAPNGPIRVRLASAPAFWLVDRVRLAERVSEVASSAAIAPARAPTRDDRPVDDLLRVEDGRCLALQTGRSVELTFAVSDPPRGLARSYLVRTSGWSRMRVAPDAIADTVLIARTARDPGAIVRLSLERMNALLARGRP